VIRDELAELRRMRRERREARRAKQREQNVLRAAKMHTARLAYEREHPTATTPRLRTPAATGTATATHYHVGCSGWFYWHWKDHIYRDIARDKWFQKYAATFGTVELNAPFYGWPTVATVQGWRRQLGGRRRFVYAIKVSERITHVKRFVGTKTLIRDFGLIADLLGDRFGCFLFQLPPSVHYSPAMLKRIVTQLDGRRVNVVEFRHRSWWNENVYRAFRDSNTVFCSCSGPRLPDELVKTSDEVYVRFHGTKQWYRHDYTTDELSVWTQRIRDSGASRVWAYFNNDREGYAIKNAKELIRQLKRSP
jgi:uncharacterized protein YecE (DUF72 family)